MTKSLYNRHDQIYMFKYTAIICLAFVIAVLTYTSHTRRTRVTTLAAPLTRIQPRWWNILSIDTMKYSRDLSREKLEDQSFDSVIDKQMILITRTGATHVAIATPYDEEFVPMLRRWVQAARRHGLKVWFRGNFSGWERWFEYERISRDEHLTLTKSFLQEHMDLFEDGDIYTSCPECENGGPGDPRQTGDAEGHRLFLIAQTQLAKQMFEEVGREVRTDIHSMNLDVAKLVMDKATTQAVGGTVTVDHYVSDPVKFADDVREIATRSGGRVMIGEYGAPIPDLHGKMTQEQQAEWISKATSLLIDIPQVIGMNYWVSHGGSTELWSSTDVPRSAVDAITKIHLPHRIDGVLTDQHSQPRSGVTVSTRYRSTTTDNQGYFSLPVDVSQDTLTMSITADRQIKQSYRSDTVAPHQIVVRSRTTFIESLLYWLQGI